MALFTFLKNEPLLKGGRLKIEEKEEFDKFYLALSLKRSWLLSFSIFTLVFIFFVIDCIQAYTNPHAELEYWSDLLYLFFLIGFIFFIKPSHLHQDKIETRHYYIMQIFVIATMVYGCASTVLDYQEAGMSIYLITVLILGVVSNSKVFFAVIVPASYFSVLFFIKESDPIYKDYIEVFIATRFTLYALLFVGMLVAILQTTMRNIFVFQKQLKLQNRELELESKENRELTEELHVIKEQLQEMVDEKTYELKEAKEQAERSDHLKSTFLANISHEIRTPLNAILGFSEIITSQNIEEEKRKQFNELIRSNSSRLLDQINSILIYSKLETGNLKLLKSTFSINGVIKYVAKLWHNKFEECFENGDCFCDMPLENGKDVIYADKAMLSFCLNIFLNNAFKFTDGKGVRLGYRIENGNVFFYVQDQGPGIGEDKLELVFEPFYQTKEVPDSHVDGGTGLGLSIVKKLSHLMNGDVKVNSQIGRGSEFQLIIPFENGGVLSQAMDTKFFVPDFSSKNILIVDDALITIDYYKVLVNETHASSFMCTSVESALEFIDLNTSIDMVIIGLKPTEYGVVGLLNRIKVHYPKIPVVTLISVRERVDVNEILEFGFTDFIMKPVNRRSFYPVLSKYLVQKKVMVEEKN